MNPWHDLDPGLDADGLRITGVVEIPRGSTVKYELDKASGAFRVDRIVPVAEGYPLNYGFIPRTAAADGDPLDFVVLGEFSVATGALVTLRIVGFIDMDDEGVADGKLVCVAIGDRARTSITDINGVERIEKEKLRHFFEAAGRAEHQAVVVTGFRDAEAALSELHRSLERYKRGSAEQ
jgi:inorganic pyrophosphatase